jgi:hypothetical protein
VKRLTIVGTLAAGLTLGAARSEAQVQSPSLWLLRGGPSGRLVRLTAPAPSGGDAQPSFRRNP